MLVPHAAPLQPAEPPKPIVPFLTDHAVIRWLERVEGIDIAKVEREIMTPATITALKAGATGIIVRGHVLKAKAGRIMTVVGKEMVRRRPAQPLKAPPKREADQLRSELRKYFEELAEGMLT